MKTKKGAPESAPVKSLKPQHKDSKKFRSSVTKSVSFIATAELRANESEMLTMWFREHPDACICRRDVEQIIGKPINHCTRVVADLLEAGIIEHAYNAVSKHSRIPVQFVRLARPQMQERREMKATQLKLF